MRRALLIAVLVLLALPLGAQEASESLEREARKAFGAGQFKRAAVKFEGAADAAADPSRRAKMRLQEAWSHYNDKNLKAAREALSEALSLKPDLEIVVEFFSPEFLKLVDDVRGTVRAEPTPPAADLTELKRVARAKLAAGDAEDVVHDLTYNVPPERMDAELKELLATAYEKLGRFSEATRVRVSSAEGGTVGVAPLAPTAVPRPSASPPLPATSGAPARGGAPDYLALGQAALSRGDSLNAQAAANRLLELDPTSSEAYRILGEAYLLRGEKAFGEASLKQSLKHNEKNEATLLVLYTYYSGEKNWEGALECLRRVTAVNPANRDRLLALGRKMRADGDLGKARDVFAAGAAALPTDVPLLTEYATVLLQLNDVDGALEPLMKAATLQPDREIVRANLAAVLRRKGLFREAEREYREALRSDPDYVPALLGLGTLLIERERFADAVEPLRKAATRDPQNAEAAWTLARAQRLAGRPADAAETLTKAADLLSAEIWNEAGVVAYGQGRYAEAVDLFGRALAKDPGSEVYKTNRDRAAEVARFVSDSGLTPAPPRQGTDRP